MIHNSDIVVAGSHGSTDLQSTEELGTAEAGLVCHKKSDGTVTLLSSDGQSVGVSLGENLSSDSGKISVARCGNLIPVQVTPEAVRIGNVDYLAKELGVSVITLAGGTAGSEAVSIDGKVITVEIDDGVSTATQVAAAVMASVPALTLLTSAVIQSGQGATAQSAAAETAIPVAVYAVPGAAFKFSATTGKATSGGTTSGAIFVSTVKKFLKMDKTYGWCAYVDMGGGL